MLYIIIKHNDIDIFIIYTSTTAFIYWNEYNNNHRDHPVCRIPHIVILPGDAYATDVSDPAFDTCV